MTEPPTAWRVVHDADGDWLATDGQIAFVARNTVHALKISAELAIKFPAGTGRASARERRQLEARGFVKGYCVGIIIASAIAAFTVWIWS